MSKINFQNVHTMVGADAKIDGPIRLREGIIVYGQVHGDIVTENGAKKVPKFLRLQKSGGRVVGHASSVTYGLRGECLRCTQVHRHRPSPYHACSECRCAER